MKNIYIILIVTFVSFWMMNCKDPLDGKTFTMSTEQPIGLYLEDQPEFSLWVDLLKKTDLYNTLNINTSYTCFVADNDAVNEYLKEKGYNSIDAIPAATAEYLVRYHVIPGTALTHSTFSGMIPNKTASGDYLSVKYGDEGINSMYVNDISLIVKMDIEVTNGYIHQIDKVLDPIIETVWDLIAANNDYSIFREALQLCELDEWLTSKVKYLGEAELDDYKTVFIISDQTFIDNGINNIEDLKARYPSNNYLSDSSAFRKFITYHIINSFSDFGDLATFDENVNVGIKNIHTVAPAEMFTIEDISGQLIINRHYEAVYLVEEKYDQQANNGYIHEVDKLMDVTPPAVIKAVWDFVDYDECKVLDAYRTHPGSSSHSLDQTRYSIDREHATGIRWQTIPDNDNAVMYQLRDQSGVVGQHNYDWCWISLGNVGWVEFTVPAVPPGTYQLTIYKMGYGSRGKLQMYIDGEKFGAVLDFSTGGGYSNNLGQKTFGVQQEHVVRFVALKSGQTEMDRIVLTPVN